MIENKIHFLYIYNKNGFLMSIRKNNQLRSKEAQTIAHTTEELEVLSDALEHIQDLIDSTTGVEKTQLKLKKADLEIQKQLNESRKNYTYSKFSSKYGSSLSAEDIARQYNGDNAPSSTSKTAAAISKGINVAVDAYARLETISAEKEFETIAAQADILMADINALGQKSVMAAELISKAYQSAIDSSLSSLIDGINEGAYAAAANVIDLGTQSKLMALEQQRIDLENKNTKDLRIAQKKTALDNLDAQKVQAITNISSEAARLAGHALNDVEVSFLGFGGSTGDAPGAIADAAADIAEGAAAAHTALTQMEGKLYTQRFENEKRITEAQLKYNQDVARKWIETAANIEKAWLQFAQKIEGGLLKSEAAANDMGIGMGFSGEQLKRFKQSMFESQVAVSKWGKTLEDVKKMQNSYQETTGRNIQFSADDFDTSFALDYLAGQDGLSAQLTGAMELFNHSVSDSNEMFGEMYKSVSKIGLDGRKFLKDLTKNLKLAERFNFKGGVKGMMEMAKWAQNTRFNMDSLPEILESISSEGLEGAITKAAGMQVLGGQFAMGADPLAMLWERYNDPMALAQREQDMLKGIGSFDSKTGEFSFNMVEQLQLEQFAKYAGQSVEDLMNQQRQRIKGERMGNLLQGKNWDKDGQALITNKAQMKNGEWVVTMDDNTTKRVADLNEEDLNHLKPETNEEKLVDYVYDIRDLLMKSEEVKKNVSSRLELDGLENAYKEVEQRISQVMNDFNTNYDNYLNEFLSKMHLATESHQTMLDIMAQGNTNIESAQEDILQEGKNIASTLAQVNQLLQNSLNQMNGLSINRSSTGPSSNFTPIMMKTVGADPINHVDVKNGGRISGGMVINPVLDDKGNPTGRFTQSCAMDNVGRNISYPIPLPASQNDTPNDLIKRLPPKISVNDGIISNEESPIYTVASRITPIHDGSVQLAQSDPKDTAIFAKTGGPFDTLFNGVFAKITEISNIIPKSLPYEFPEISIKDSFSSNGNNKNMTATNSQPPLRIEPITLNINLNGALGQSKDFMEELSRNPLMIRTLTQLIAENISKSINGGRAIYDGIISTSRFKGMRI